MFWSSLRALLASCFFLEKPWCDITGIPFPYDMGEGTISIDALAHPPPFQRLRSAVLYSGIARDMVRALKYHDRLDLAPWMASWMKRAGHELIPETDIIVPVPLHSRRFFVRGFNQSAELARALSHLTGRPFSPEVVERKKHTCPQIDLESPAKRQENVRTAFRVPYKFIENIKDKAVLLVDDVLTTGATVSSVSQTLLRAGVSRVDVLTFARVLPRGHFMNKEQEIKRF